MPGTRLNPSPHARPWLTSLEPWQRDALLALRETLNVDSDAVLRAGVTLVILLTAAGLHPVAREAFREPQ